MQYNFLIIKWKLNENSTNLPPEALENIEKKS